MCRQNHKKYACCNCMVCQRFTTARQHAARKEIHREICRCSNKTTQIIRWLEIQLGVYDRCSSLRKSLQTRAMQLGLIRRTAFLDSASMSTSATFHFHGSWLCVVDASSVSQAILRLAGFAMSRITDMRRSSRQMSIRASIRNKLPRRVRLNLQVRNDLSWIDRRRKRWMKHEPPRTPSSDNPVRIVSN